jgi:hypothetical protein
MLIRETCPLPAALWSVVTATSCHDYARIGRIQASPQASSARPLAYENKYSRTFRMAVRPGWEIFMGKTQQLSKIVAISCLTVCHAP